MASLTNLEKRRLEEMFGMSSGYVLDFSNRTFAEFFQDVAEVDIYAARYDSGSGSKANRLRAYWTQEPDAAVADVLAALIEIGAYENALDPKQAEFAQQTVRRLRGSPPAVSSGSLAGGRPSHAVRTSGDNRPLSWEVALSFAGEQRPYVVQVATALRAAGVSVFYDEFEDLWGKDLTVELEKAYRAGSRYVVVFVSADYISKPWTNHERQHALAGRIERGDDSVLPVHFDGSRLPGLPTSIGYLPVHNMGPEELAERILAKLRTPGAS
ncbi:MAG: toll/interleukin-1 receptor domain-containing protein [Dehalococcoidia bacterium]